MNKSSRIVTPGPGNTLRGENDEILTPPLDWAFYPAGDAGITRKITAEGIFWRVQVRKGKRIISKGVWAPVEIIEKAKADVEAVRSTDAYKRKLESSRKSRQKKQAEYETEFLEAVKNFLSFDQCYNDIQEKLAKAVTRHAIPVGSGTVARTEMIPIEERAARAVIAWMRHNTTAYDTMHIPRVKGMRKETRRLLAKRSREILESYRRGDSISEYCPVKQALRDIK